MIKKSILILIFLVISLIAMGGRIQHTKPDLSRGRVAPPIFKQAHRYHGIKYSKLQKGEWIFYRDNKRCRLFTKAFYKSINRRR